MKIDVRLFGTIGAEAHLHIRRDVEMSRNDKHVLRVPAHRFKHGAPAVCERMRKHRPRLELIVRIIALALVGKPNESTQVTEVFVGIFIARAAALTIILRQVRRVHHDGRGAARSQHVHRPLAGRKDQRDAREGVRDAEALEPEGRLPLEARSDQDVVEARCDRYGLDARHKIFARFLIRLEDGMHEGIELDFPGILRHCGGAKSSGDGTGKKRDTDGLEAQRGDDGGAGLHVGASLRLRCRVSFRSYGHIEKTANPKASFPKRLWHTRFHHTRSINTTYHIGTHAKLTT